MIDLKPLISSLQEPYHHVCAELN